MDLTAYKDILLGASTVAIDGRVIGFTENGVSITPEVEVLRAPDIDQVAGDVPLKEMSRKYTIKFTTPSISLENLALAWGIDNSPDTANGVRTFVLGRTTTTIATRTVKIFSNYFDDRKVTFTFTDAKVVAAGEVGYSKKDHAKLAITLEALDGKVEADE
jgi:hypothetical protein